MSGRLRFVARMSVVTILLATGGVGAYYGTLVGWPLLRRAAGKNLAEVDRETSSRSQQAPFSDTDLDAVASAWAEPAASERTVPADSSATARTAAVTTARAENIGDPNDRYAIASGANAPAEAALAEPLEEFATIAATEPEVVPLEMEPEPTVSDESEAAAAEESVPPTSLARGQEPDEFVPNEVSKLEPLAASNQEPNMIVADQDARQAFAMQPDAPQPARSGDNRYGAAGTEQREPAITNPFHSTATASSAAPAQVVEALPATPDEMAGQLSDLQQSASAEPANEAFRSSPADIRGFGSGEKIEPARELREGSLFDSAEAPSAVTAAPAKREGQADAGDGTGVPGERALEGPQRPALEIQKLAPAEIQVGKPTKFVVQVRNVGNQAADGVTVRDEVPQGTRLISTTPAAQASGSQLEWQLGKLSPGEDRTIEMQLMPTAEGEIGSVATVAYSAQASVKTRCTMPQLAIRMTAPEKVMIGQEQRVKIEVRNPGSGDATGVMLFENVPPNVRHAAGPALEFEIGTLRAGETREMELVLLAEKPGHTVNLLSARADGNLQVQQQVEFEVIAPALSVDVNGPERRYLERPATYEVSVENPGTAPAHDVQIVTKLPRGMRFVRANNMGEYDAATHAVYWSLAELPEGQKGTVEVVAMPTEAGPQTLEVESRAGQGLSDETKQQIIVDGLAAIMFEVRDLEDPIEVGRETGYEIRVVNQGTKAAANVQVAVSLPPGMQFISAEGETQHVAQRGGILFDPVPQLAPKADTVFRLRVKGSQPGDQRVTVEVKTEDIHEPIRREESTRVFGDE